MWQSKTSVVFLVLILCFVDIRSQSSTEPPTTVKPQTSQRPLDYTSLFNEGLQLLNSTLSSGILQQISSITSLLPKMNEQTLVNILQRLNVSVTSSQVDSVVKFAQGAFSNLTQMQNASSYQPFAKSQQLYGSLSPGCKASMGLIAAGVTLRSQWALQMIDSWGKPSAGILTGNSKWTGSFDQCLDIKPEVQGVTPFNAGYCGANIPFQISGQNVALYLGMCVPSTCTYFDVLHMADAFISLIPVADLPSASYAICKTDIEYDTRAIIALVVCGFFLALMIFATIFDVFMVSPELKRISKATAREEDEVNSNAGISHISNGINRPNGDKIKIEMDVVNGHTQTNGSHPASMYKLHDNTVKPIIKRPSNYPGMCAKLVLSFSVWTNGKKLLSTSQSGGALGAINGIRFLSMTWVILGHTYVFALMFGDFANKISFMPKMLKRLSFMAVANALLSVDTFFTLSGLLLSYVFMKEMKRERGRVNWFMFYFHRFWRLTPPYMLVMMVDIALLRYMGDGPAWVPTGLEQNFCEDTWWTNLIYLNNFMKLDKMCFAWSWYLANDMQFYVVSPLLLVPLYFSKKIGGTVNAVFLLAVTIVSAVVSAQHQLPATQFSIVPNPHVGDYFPEYYIKPYCRMGPYIMGIITGYIIFKTGGKYKIKPAINLFIWAFVAALACLVLYGTFEESKGNAMSVGIAAML
ncbi:nose resistant to fluoxetine protein 6-like [Argopecten irradians]|uniref:nose resistant to fluoxetine protein 6-like n=1 Tax=Argopecten irradians TaxID=31199 RepID=UPI003714E5F8